MKSEEWAKAEPSLTEKGDEGRRTNDEGRRTKDEGQRTKTKDEGENLKLLFRENE